MVNNAVKVFLIASLLALLAWTVYWLIPSFVHFSNLILGLPDQYTGKEWYFIPSHFGLITRFVGITLGLLGTFLVWVREKSFLQIKNLVAIALLMEVAYSVSLLPSFWSLVATFRATNLGIAYLLQIIFTAPLLAVLAVKVFAYKGTASGRISLWKWSGIAFAGYIGALWANATLRWADMLSSEGAAAFLISGIRAIGFFDAAIFMSLAVTFATIAAYMLTKTKQYSAKKWISLALIMVGLHYTIYLIYSYYVNVLGSAILIDIWTVPLLGLGVALLISKPQHSTNETTEVATL